MTMKIKYLTLSLIMLTTTGSLFAQKLFTLEELNFGGLLGYGPVMNLRSQSPAKMINRGGRIPAPLQSLKN